jgi:hypothetical protein
LQFVVLSLIAGRQSGAGDPAAGQAFATPTIVHFSTVLGLAAILSAPWETIEAAAAVWGLAGLCGVVYSAVVTRRMRRQSAYQPEFEDWLFHVLLPFAAYATLSVSASVSGAHLQGALFGVGAAVLVLLFVGIHNAWDAVTYHVYVSRERNRGGKRS